MLSKKPRNIISLEREMSIASFNSTQNYWIYLNKIKYYNLFIFIEIVNYFHEKNEEIKAKMYDALVNEKIPFYLDKFEQIVSDNNGYFVNGKVCKFYFFNFVFIFDVTIVIIVLL